MQPCLAIEDQHKPSVMSMLYESLYNISKTELETRKINGERYLFRSSKDIRISFNFSIILPLSGLTLMLHKHCRIHRAKKILEVPSQLRHISVLNEAAWKSKICTNHYSKGPPRATANRLPETQPMDREREMGEKLGIKPAKLYSQTFIVQ